MPNLTFIGQSAFNSTKTFGGTTVGGLSGITYDVANNRYFTVSDARDNSRFYDVSINLDALRSKTPGAVNFTGVTTLKDTSGNAFAPNISDTEGIALTSGGVFISSEGVFGATPVQPFINRFNIGTGQQNQVLSVPAKFAASTNPNSGIRNNRGFESLTVTPDQQFLFTATEDALKQDGNGATTTTGSRNRILRYDLDTNLAGPEYLYNTDKSNGISEILAVDNNTLLVLERSVIQTELSLKLYQVSLAGATDISAFNNIPANANPVQKTLIANLFSSAFSRAGFTYDNFEGMTFGPTLANGNRSLILLSDNNFGQYELFGNLTRFAAFEFNTNPIQSSVTTTLSANAQNLRLTGTGNINGTGHESNNIIAGNDANNILSGKQGYDTVLGNAGNDRIVGGIGNDTLTGGAGADCFYRKYSTTGIDTITDFQVAQDSFYVSASGFGGGLVRGDEISAAQFTIGTAAADSRDRFIYNNDTGALFFDADGTGTTAQVQIATLSTGLAMTNANIYVFA